MASKTKSRFFSKALVKLSAQGSALLGDQDGENTGHDDDDLKTSNLVKEQETKAIKADMAKLEKTLEEERKRNEEYLQSLRYLQADFENYRKRVDREIRELEEFATLGIARKLIPVLDDLDLAVATATKAEDKGLLGGVKMVQKNLQLGAGERGARE